MKFVKGRPIRASFFAMWYTLKAHLHTDAYNLYWFGGLCSVLVASGISVLASHLQQHKQHPGWRLFSDWFIRAELGFVSFGIALFVSAYFGGEQKTLGVWFGVLIVLGIVLHLFGMWLTKPQILILHDGDEQCSVDERGRCQKPLRRVAKLQLLVLPAILFLCSFGGACLLAFAVTDPKTAGQNEPAANLVPLNVSFADIQTGADAYRDNPTFLRDNLDKLETEQQRAKRPDFVIATIESEKPSSYGRFCWMISLRGDYPRKNFALSARAAYLVHSGQHFTFDDLQFSGEGDPFTAIIVAIPSSRDGDKVLIPLAIYARSGGNQVYEKVGDMLQWEVKCP